MSLRASVVICVYNRPVQVLTCLDSLLKQDVRNFEIVIVDDASTDNTPEVLRSFQLTHSEWQIQIVRTPKNLGVSGARNCGIDAAKGPLILFTDSDCIADRAWVGKLVSALEQENVAAVAGRVIDVAPRTYAEVACAGTTTIQVVSIQNRALVGCNMGFRLEVVKNLRFEETLRFFCDEDELAWRLQSLGHLISFEPEALVHHDHPMNVSSYLSRARRQGMGSGRYWYKRGSYLGRDLWFLTLGLATIPLGFANAWMFGIPTFFFLLQIAALAFNQWVLKQKTFLVTLWVLPLEVVYTLYKASGVYLFWIRLAFGYECSIQKSKAEWQRQTGISSSA